jgi:hypothetical protein
MPFTHQQRSRPQGYPIAGLGIAPIEWGLVSTPLTPRFFPQQSPYRPIEISEGRDLQAMAQHPHQQPPRQMRGRFPAEMVAPLSAEAFEFETFQPRKDRRQGSVS